MLLSKWLDLYRLSSCFSHFSCTFICTKFKVLYWLNFYSALDLVEFSSSGGSWMDTNFKPWFQRRRAVTEQDQDRLWRQTRIKADIQHLISKFSEVEIVDSFNVIVRLLLKEIQVIWSPQVLQWFYAIDWLSLSLSNIVHPAQRNMFYGNFIVCFLFSRLWSWKANEQILRKLMYYDWC